MRYRTQILLAFLPIFVLLGASGEMMRAWLEAREFRWGLREQASSLAVAIAEFLQGRSPADLTAGGPPASGGRPPAESLALIVQGGQARRLRLYGPDGRAPLHRFGPAPGGRGDATVSAATQARLLRETWVVGDFVTEGEETTLTAHARWRTAAGDTAGYLVVTIGAEEYPRALAAEKRRIAAAATVSLLVGLIAAGLIVVPVTRGLRDLREAAEQSQEGHPLIPPDSRCIREIEELGETFGTMATLLHEAMHKARRILIENEQLRTPADLAATFRAHFAPPVITAFPGGELCARIIGPEPGGAFAGWRRSDGNVCVFVGAVAGPEELQRAALASAARRLIEDNLGRLAPEVAMAEAANLLAITEWECLAWTPPSGAPRRWAGRGGTTTPRAASGNAPTRAFCLHTFGPAGQRVVDACLAGFEDLPAGEIAERLTNLLASDTAGAFVVVRRLPA